MKAPSSYKLASEIAPSLPAPSPTLWPSKAELTRSKSKTMQEATQPRLSPNRQGLYQPRCDPSLQDKAQTPFPQPQHKPVGSKESLPPEPDKDKTVTHHIPRLRAVVESQAFKNVLVDEMDMMLSRAATLIQANWRGYWLRQKLISQMMAAKAIQEAWRRFKIRRLLRSGKLVEKKVCVDEGDIPYHPPQQVRFQHPGESKSLLAQPSMVSKETQFPFSNTLATCTHRLALQTQSMPQPGMQDPCPIGGANVAFLPHQTVAIRLPCPVSLDAKCCPCLLTRTIRNACLGHVEGDMVKTKQVTARANKPGAPGPPPSGRYAQAVHGSLKTQTQAHMEPEVFKALPQTGPAPVTAKTLLQTYPGATMTKTPPQPCVVPMGMIAKTPPQMYPAAAVTKTPLQACLAAVMNKTPPQPCSAPTVTITKSPPQMFQASPVAKASPQTSQAAAVTKTPFQSCLGAMLNRSPPQPCPAALVSKTPTQMRAATSITNTSPPTRPAAMMAKISPQICLLASTIKPPTQTCPVAPATKTPPQMCPVPTTANTPTQMCPAAPVAKAPLQTCAAAATAKTPSQTLTGASVTKTSPQTRLAAMVNKTPAKFRSVAAVIRTLCLSPPTDGNLKSSPPVAVVAGIPNTSSHTHLDGPEAKAVGNAKQTAGTVKTSSYSYWAEGNVKYLSLPQRGAGTPKVPARPPLEAEKSKAFSQKQGPVDAGKAGGQAWNSAVPSVAVGPMNSTVAPGGPWEPPRAPVPLDTVGREAAVDPRRSGELVASMQVLEKTVHAVVTIQAGTRGYLVRRTIKVWHQGAVVIQAAWRGYCVRRDLARLSGAATVIQAMWRGFCARKGQTQPAWLPATWARLGSRARSTSDHRCFQSCQPHVCALCQSLSPRLGGPPSVVMLVGSSPRTCHKCGHTLPTRVVHGMGRGSQAGVPWGRVTPTTAQSPQQSRHQGKAATAIQSAWKGFTARRQLRQQQVAAKVLQAAWRGHHTRANLTTDVLLGPTAWDSPQRMQWPSV
ncbi:IQ domain-containing protein N [Suricata suricatta]|uniref:IQ domain-containing protein N n=1 Tax=Suricata suricatta TaxID=37032 RepID=UPI0011557F3B|nr:IQ domain-containing protein N [Suricata suricatta]XP_029774649.1 IQ domain-containing protein N [Suricata suricatta]